MKTTYGQRLSEMAAYLRRNPNVTLPSGRVITAVELAIVRIYQRQTADEQAVSETRHDNNRGFQQRDAKFGSMMARLILKGERVHEYNMARCIRMAVRYRRQLLELQDERRAKTA